MSRPSTNIATTDTVGSVKKTRKSRLASTLEGHRNRDHASDDTHFHGIGN